MVSSEPAILRTQLIVAAAAAKEPVISAIGTIFTAQIPMRAIPAIKICVTVRDVVDFVIPLIRDPADLAARHQHDEHKNR